MTIMQSKEAINTKTTVIKVLNLLFPNAQILCYPVTDFESHNGSYKNLLGDKYAEMAEALNPIAIAPTDTPAAFIPKSNSSLSKSKSSSS